MSHSLFFHFLYSRAARLSLSFSLVRGWSRIGRALSSSEELVARGTEEVVCHARMRFGGCEPRGLLIQ